MVQSNIDSCHGKYYYSLSFNVDIAVCHTAHMTVSSEKQRITSYLRKISKRGGACV